MRIKKSVAILLGTNMFFSPAATMAAPTIPGFAGSVPLPMPPAANTLPVPRGNAWTGVNNITTDSSQNRMVIEQNQPRAVIDWSSFNIGANAAVYFSQKDGQGVAQRDWAALNRIYDRDPSQIYGSLTADGKVYLINQNGILFGPGSQVNVHSLVASTLNLWETDFKNGLLRFRAENYQHPDYKAITVDLNENDKVQFDANAASNKLLSAPDSNAAVSNHGTMTTDTGGYVFLLGPRVENAGAISAPLGKINMVAVQGAGTDSSPGNSEVSIKEFTAPVDRDVFFSDKAVPGSAVNLETGRLTAESGRIGMYGATVRQDGLIRAVTAVKRGGVIFLAASNRVATGARSVTETPVSDSQERVDQSFGFSGGTVTIGGLHTKADEKEEPIKQPLQLIEHHGSINAPAGAVTLNAVERVFMDDGSSISVAGLWLDRPASANILEPQLNSAEMKDDYGQKNGPQKGEKIKIDVMAGSAVGDVSGYYLAQEKTAEERSTKGGTIIIDGHSDTTNATPVYTPLGELIVKKGALIDFSGGGTHYGSGAVETTKLIAGNRVYDISNAPQWLGYDRVLGRQTVSHRRYGVTEEFSGLYLGGGAPLMDYVPSRTVGSDAGTMEVAAGRFALDGRLNGAVTRGQYQTRVTPYSDQDHLDYDISVARGLEEPVGGKLVIGKDPDFIVTDSAVDEIVVRAATDPLSDGFGAEDPLNRSRTELSATLLNDAGLSKLKLFANTSVTIDRGATISLLPGGSYSDAGGTRVFSSEFVARGRRIEHLGTVEVPGGSAEFTLRDNLTTHPFLTPGTGEANSRFADLASTLYFAPGSVVSVRGETVDNSSAGRANAGTVRTGITSGGRLVIKDETVEGTITGNNLVVARGALLDVSGGYEIDSKGKVTGGDAGTLELLGATLSLAGDVRGLALPGKKGGEIKLHAGEVVVGTTGATMPAGYPPDSTPNEQIRGKLLLADDRFRDTGFTRISLTAINDVTFNAGTRLEPSTARLAAPAPAVEKGNAFVPAGESINTLDYLGPTSVKAVAGKKIYTGTTLDGEAIPSNPTARVDVSLGSSVRTAPGGTISMSGPVVDVAGKLDAPGGSIELTATDADLTIRGGSVSAAGYLKPVTTTVAGLPSGDLPQAAGTVSLESSKGSIILENGAKVDVSGTAPTERLIRGADGTPERITVAGDPGTLKLTYGRELVLDGEIDGRGRHAGVRGGTQTVSKNSATSSAMVVSGADIDRYLGSGFDALTLKSANTLLFESDMDKAIGRSLTLDAPLISGAENHDVSLRAPWITLTNSGRALPAAIQATKERGGLTLVADWIDVEGSTTIAGFGDVSLEAKRDLRLTDRTYVSGNTIWEGGLETGGRLTLQAARIYPTTETDFTVTAHGKITILPSGVDDPAPIYSAGGNLTIKSLQTNESESGIEHRGLLAAPMGSIALSARNIDETASGGRVFLAEGSIIKTSGDASVSYGDYDGTYWTAKDPNDASSKMRPEVQGTPEKSIELDGSEVIVKEGATLDIAGGGSVYTYLWQQGLEGTTDPISVVGISELTNQKTRSDRYVIMPDNSVQLPGFTYTYTDTDGKEKSRLIGAVHLGGIRLDDGTYLKEGTYSLLPEQFAFVPGALIISDLGPVAVSGAQPRTDEKYQAVSGYSTTLGTDVKSEQLNRYSVRRAADVLKEGNFSIKELAAGDAGSLTIAGNTTVMAGTLNAGAFPGYRQGSLGLSGGVITVRETVSGLPAGFDFDTPVPAGLEGELQVSATALSGKGVGSLTLGNLDGSDGKPITSKVFVKQGSVLNVPNITLAARDSVTVEEKAQVKGLSEAGGTVTLMSPVGKVDIQANALVHASDAISLDVNDINLQGELVTDHSTLNLTANQIYFVPDSFTRTGAGLYITDKLWDSFNGYSRLGLTSRSDLSFLRDVDMTEMNTDTLTLDAQRITGPAKVFLKANEINLLNSGSTTDRPSLSAASGSITLQADEINMAAKKKASIVFDGFGTVSLSSLNDLTVRGEGALKAGGDLNISAARLTTSFYRDETTPYTAANFNIEAGGAVSIGRSGGAAGSASTPGGTLGIEGRKITQSGTIEVASGRVRMTAEDGISLTEGARILARGTRQATADPKTYEYLAGGDIELRANAGDVILKSGSLLDVSASDQGDAGAIALIASNGGVTVDGTMAGSAASGRGGSFTLEAETVDLSALNDKLKAGAGGFTERLDIRARSGNLTVDAGETVAAREIILAADGRDGNGNIGISGELVASDGVNGGRVELYAGKDLTVTGSIRAAGTQEPSSGASGGEVFLGSEDGTLAIRNGVIDVSGGPDGGKGGSVTIRALRNTNFDPVAGPIGVNMALSGEIRGASRIVAEAYKVYNKTGSITTADITGANGWLTEAGSYMDTGTTGANRGGRIRDGLLANLAQPAGWDPAAFHLRPGVEVRSTGDLILDSAVRVGSTSNATLDLSAARYSLEPGVLTLRAAGNLTVNANLVDHPTQQSFADRTKPNLLSSANMQDSWGLNLVAGADLSAASHTGIKAGVTKDLTIAGGRVVYTENAPILFAAAQNVVINEGVAAGYMVTDSKAYTPLPNVLSVQPMSYSLASYGGTIRGVVGRDLVIDSRGKATSAAIQTATGDIDIRVGGNLNLKNRSAIRTTGEYAAGTEVETGPGTGVRRAAQGYDFWTYRNGGDIRLDVEGNVAGFGDTSGTAAAWDLAYGGGTLASNRNSFNKHLSASFDGVNATQGIATMGGGNIAVRTGGTFKSQIGAFGRKSLDGGGNDLGRGDLFITTGSDLSGRFRISDGTARLISAGSFGTSDVRQVIEMAAAGLSVAAQGDVHLGAVLNPDNGSRADLFASTTENRWNLTYTEDSSMQVASLTGDVTFYGVSPFSAYQTSDYRQRILPASVTMLAAGDLKLQEGLFLAPSQDGSLRLHAGGTIDGQNNGLSKAKIFMTDQAPANVYGYQAGASPDISRDNPQDKILVHLGDDSPVEVSAGGDIRNIQLFLTQKAEISAGRDIWETVYAGQNIDPADVTTMRAGRDIRYFFIPEESVLGDVDLNYLGIQQGGPGAMVVQAGRNIDLGNSQGINSTGDSTNPFLGSKGADLIVVAGAKSDLAPEDAVTFFDGQGGTADHVEDSRNGLRKAGKDYSDLLAQGKTPEAQKRIEEARNEIIRPWFDGPANDGSGTITMTNSQISTSQGKDGIYILARSVLDVGRISFLKRGEKQEKNGIYTISGGPINIYSGSDVNINESRGMTFLGGDITVWSDEGNINAGRGSKTAVSPPELKDVIDPITGEVIDQKPVPPAVGSGIRAVTYDPDGLEGPLEPPPAGDIYLFAPKGVIDAGEAGIAGGKLTLGATEVLNASNISFSAGSIGVPTTSDSGVSIGALTGTGALADSTKMIEQASSLGTTKDKTLDAGTKALDNFLSNWLDVKVIDFEE